MELDAVIDMRMGLEESCGMGSPVDYIKVYLRGREVRVKYSSRFARPCVFVWEDG
jgi:hypothetical protein